MKQQDKGDVSELREDTKLKLKIVRPKITQLRVNKMFALIKDEKNVFSSSFVQAETYNEIQTENGTQMKKYTE